MGVWNNCKAVVPHMLKQGGGNIVIASSVTGDIKLLMRARRLMLATAALAGLDQVPCRRVRSLQYPSVNLLPS